MNELLMKRLLLAILAASFARAQGPEFEVASLKPSPPPEGNSININLGTLRDGRLTFGNASLSDCLKFAYSIVSDSQIAGPDWIKSKEVRFDIVAPVDPAIPREQVQLMLQKLLADRLKVVLHHEKRELSYLALVAAKGGTKMRKTDVKPGGAGGNFAARGRITGRSMAMLGLATLLSRFERETVVDMTGLEGSYEFTLMWTPDDGPPVLLNDAPVDVPSLSTAIQEQLGLRLESRKGPLDVLVIDRADKTPVEN